MVTEIELKYSLFENHEVNTAAQVQNIIEQLLTDHELSFTYQKKQLTNCYFDTPNLSLRKQKIALRTRGTQCANEPICYEQTIKTSGRVIAGLHQRPEYNVDISDTRPIISLFPDNLWQPNTNIVDLQSKLIELFSTNFIRHTWLVSIENSQVELVIDSGEICCEGLVEQDKIYEVELELVSGNVESIFTLVKLLFSKLSLRPGQLTKAARGYALYKKNLQQESEVESSKASNLLGKTSQSKAEASAEQPYSMIMLPKNCSINDAFSQGVEITLTKLQLALDSYVAKPSLKVLMQISEYLTFIRQGFWLFDEVLTAEELKLKAELTYFIRTIHWVDIAEHIDVFLNKQSRYQKEVRVSQSLISKLQLSQNRYPNDSQVLALIHSERFNNLQLDLLALLLKRNNENITIEADAFNLAEFASLKLSESSDILNSELAKLQQPKLHSPSTVYLSANSLFIRALLTTSWFNSLFADFDAVRKYETPRLDIKQGISELNFLHLLQQQLKQLPKPDEKLAQWVENKSENLIAALDQSSAKALSIKPYWL